MIVHKNVLNSFLVNNCRLGRVDINPPSLIFNNNNMALQVWLPLNKNGADKNQGLANINIVNNASYEVSGKLGGCYKNGTINSGWGKNYNACLGLSASCWINIPTIEGNAIILGSVHNYPANTRFYVGCYNGYFSGGFGNTSWGDAASNRKIESNTWYHLCMTTFGTNWKLYINGQCVQEKTSSANPVILYGNIYIGEKQALYNDFRIYDHCLSPKEVKEISKGLVLHYPLNDAYVEETSNLFSTNLTHHRNWNNSGSAIWNWDDNTIPKINNSIIYSISRTDTGNSAIGCGAYNLVAGKTYTASVYIYLSGNVDSNIFYIRNVDTNIATLKYNNDANPQKWPQNQWIRATATFTPSTAYNSCYICSYLNNANSKRALTCWQIEEKDHATPYTSNTRNETTVYDCSGYQNNGTISGLLSCSADSPRYKVSTNMSGQYISCNTTNIQQVCNAGAPFTISSWIKRTANYTNSSGLFEAGSSSGNLKCLHLVFRNTGQFVFAFYSCDLYPGFNINNHIGEWNLITCTYDGSTMKVYINGELIGSRDGAILNLQTITPYTVIGKAQTANSPDLLSDFRVYATALSEEDIKELYNTSCIINS